MALQAAVDIGTNSIRLLIGQVTAGQVRPVATLLATTRLGEGATGRLLPEAISRTVTGLGAFKKKLAAYAVDRVKVVATSAVREASNAEQFIKAVSAKLGWEVQILSGTAEAALSYRGAVSGLTVAAQPVVVLDIGGGSTEFTYARPDGLVTWSYPLGAVRCSEQATSRKLIRQTLQPALSQLRALGLFTLVGTGGTVTSLVAMEKKLRIYDPKQVHGAILSKETVDRWQRHIQSLSMTARQQIVGLQLERADIIEAGVAILGAVLNDLAIPEIIVSEADLLYGLLLSQV